MKFCSECGHSEIILTTPEGDNSPREVCAACGLIFYQNPNIVAGCIVTWQDKILLCRRAIEPCSGLWTIPGGFMENGESIREAALREAQEEACARIEQPKLFSIHNLIYNKQVYVIYRGQVRNGECAAGHETSEVNLFSKGEIPWNEIAFSVIKESLRLYVEDCQKNRFEVHQGDFIQSNEPPTHY